MGTIKESYKDGVCPDCGEKIPDNVEEGSDCGNCGHVFWLQTGSTYTIYRNYFVGGLEILTTGQTLKDAQEFCKSPESSSSSCTSPEGIARTKARGPWFNCYDKE